MWFQPQNNKIFRGTQRHRYCGSSCLTHGFDTFFNSCCRNVSLRYVNAINHIQYFVWYQLNYIFSNIIVLSLLEEAWDRRMPLPVNNFSVHTVWQHNNLNIHQIIVWDFPVLKSGTFPLSSQEQGDRRWRGVIENLPISCTRTWDTEFNRLQIE